MKIVSTRKIRVETGELKRHARLGTQGTQVEGDKRASNKFTDEIHEKQTICRKNSEQKQGTDTNATDATNLAI